MGSAGSMSFLGSDRVNWIERCSVVRTPRARVRDRPRVVRGAGPIRHGSRPCVRLRQMPDTTMGVSSLDTPRRSISYPNRALLTTPCQYSPVVFPRTIGPACDIAAGYHRERPWEQGASRTKEGETVPARFESSVIAVSWIPSEAIARSVEDPIRTEGHPLRPAAPGSDRGSRRPTQDGPFSRGERAAGVHRGRRRSDRGLRSPRSGSHRCHDRPRGAGRVLPGCPPARHPTRAGGRRVVVQFVQTVGGRMGLPTPRPVPHKPFAQFWPSIAWTTLALTINADGSASHEVVRGEPLSATLDL